MGYSIVGKLYAGAKIVGYRIVGGNGKELNINYDDTVRLCKVGQISNAEIEDIDSQVIVVVQGKQDDISCNSKERLELVDIAEENGKHEAYVRHSDGKIDRIALNELWFKAVDGLINNVKAGVNREGSELTKTIKIFNK